MTFSWSAKQPSRTRGPEKGPGVAAVVGEGAQGHEQGRPSLLGELLRQQTAHRELVAVPAPLHIVQK